MAPKGQAKAKGKAARCKAAYTAEEARAQSSTAKRSRRGCGIAPSDAWLHESVQESLRANYGGMSDQEVGGTLVEGVTLVERLRRDKRAWCMEGVPALSQAYHNNNRRLYRTVRRKVDDLAVTDAKGNETPVRDAVLEGLAMLKLRRPCRSALAVIERLQYCVVAETDKGKLYGGAAAAFDVAAIEREKDLQGEKVLTLLKDLNIFKHLLASNLQPKLTALTKEAEEQSNSAGAQAKATVKTMVAAASSNCTEGGSSSSAGGKPKTAKEKRKASAMELALVDFCF
mmetsp:Transcript_63552/g.197216  ORF Transcript_63552/g.197216 Transcript_63552/m.197216 type:complete len:285 (+) Transcript_63552:65-919(+)